MARDLVALCRKACKEAQKAKVEAEAFASWRCELETEIEGTNITIGTSSTDFGIGVRVMREKRVGYAYTSDVKAIGRTVRKAISASALGGQVGFRFPSTSEMRAIKGLRSDDVAGLDVDSAFSMTKVVLEGARSIDKDVTVSSGGLLAGIERFAVVNTRGVEVLHEGTMFSMSACVVAGTEGKTSAFKSGSSRSLDVDPHEIGRKAADLAVRFQGGKAFDKGRLDVVLAPVAFAELLTYTLLPSFNGERVGTGESYLKGRLGEQVATKGFTLKDDPTVAGGLGSSSSDDEGVPSRGNILIKDGRLRMFIYDLASGAKYGHGSTGNGLRPGFRGVPSTSSRNLIIGGRSTRYEKLISGIDRGILVHDVMGAHTANMASTDFSVNSAALFMIEKGEVTHPITNAMLSGTMSELLGRMVSLGDDVQCVPSGAAFYLPSVWLQDVQVSG
jgi:PmbA protein